MDAGYKYTMEINATNYFINIQRGPCLDQELYTTLLVVNSKELSVFPKQKYWNTYSINRCPFIKPKINMG